MLSQNSKLERIKEFLRTPIGLVSTVVVVLILGVLIFFSVQKLMESRVEPEPDLLEVIFDEASGEYVRVYAPTDGSPNVSVLYVGFSKIIRNGVYTDLYTVFRAAVEEYALWHFIPLERVSYVKDSYKLADSYVFDFDIVLNEGEKKLAVRLDSSRLRKNVYGAKVTLSDEEGNVVYELAIDDSNKCNYIEPCYQDEGE